MPYLDSVEELLEAKEGEHVQFKKPRIGLTLEKRQGAAALWQMMAVASWCLVSPIKGPEVWWEAVPLNSQSAPVWG